MTWVLWRQYRSQAAVAVIAIAAFGLLMLVTGLHMASRWHSAVSECARTNSCGSIADTVSLNSGWVGGLTVLTMIVPLVFGMFWGAPVVAREWETGTIQFAWMQSVTRRRWLTVKVGWPLLAAAVFGGAIGGIVTWWYGPLNALQPQQFGPGFFDIQGIVPIGYAVFAVALGLAAGTLIGRSLPALAVTCGVFLALRFTFTFWLRAHYMPAVTGIFGFNQSFTPPGAAWVLGQGTVLPGGQLASAFDFKLALRGFGNVPASCQALAGGANPRPMAQCLSRAGYRSFVSYQPGNRFWTFQGIETGIFLVLGVALVVVTYIVASRKDA